MTQRHQSINLLQCQPLTLKLLPELANHLPAAQPDSTDHLDAAQSDSADPLPADSLPSAQPPSADSPHAAQRDSGTESPFLLHALHELHIWPEIKF